MGKKEYNYEYDGEKLVRATECDIELTEEVVTSKVIVNTVKYYYDNEGKQTKKVIAPASGSAQTIYFESNDDNTVVKFTAGGRTVTSHSKSDSFGRKTFDELQLGTDFVSRQFVYHAGKISAEHKSKSKVKSSATTQLVSQIILSNGTTLSYGYDAEERITSVVESYTVDDTPVTNTTTYTYDALGQLLTETVNGTVVNEMTYDNYGNILTKNGVAYTYDSTWKDLLTGYGEQTITYDAQGNPTSYLGHALTWEKGRQLKSFDGNTYTYNANGIRTSKTIDGIKHTYILDGTKILREVWDNNTLIPIYDNEDSVCGIIYNTVPYYFIKNLQGDVIAIVDKDATTVAKYSYDAWGVCSVIQDASNCGIATINPFRYRGYYYDTDIQMYYLQSRYYNPVVGRFINADEAELGGLNTNILRWNQFSYCENSPVFRIDPNGCYWYHRYSGFKKTSKGFNLNVNLAFLSRTFCLSYAYDFLRANGTWHWYGRTYSGMGQLRIAQELWFHALVYYIGMPIKTVLKTVGISWGWLDQKVASAQYMEINSNDSRAWVFAAFWWAGLAIKVAICRRLAIPYRILAAIIL